MFSNFSILWFFIKNHKKEVRKDKLVLSYSTLKHTESRNGRSDEKDTFIFSAIPDKLEETKEVV